MDIIRNLGAKKKRFYLSDIPRVLNPVTKTFFCDDPAYTLWAHRHTQTSSSLFFVQTLRQ